LPESDAGRTALTLWTLSFMKITAVRTIDVTADCALHLIGVLEVISAANATVASTSLSIGIDEANVS
jgi:hypothetical protein